MTERGKGWIPIFMGMTYKKVRISYEKAGMTDRDMGMTDRKRNDPVEVRLHGASIREARMVRTDTRSAPTNEFNRLINWN